ncbi:MAG: hypothetical protein KAQ62_21810 [Cyclobacteriaceae bacterium]|nr:hypothetical protein [Cyclobacteriaceae bacterium]
MLLAKEFESLLDALQIEANHLSDKHEGITINYKLLGSTLQTSHTLLLGINWEDIDGFKSQQEMPTSNEILANPNNSTYKGYLDFFSTILDNDFEKTVDYFQSIVYSRCCLFKTDAQGELRKKIMRDGYFSSKPILKKLIDITGVDTIICFNNEAYFTTRIVGEIIFDIDNFWGNFRGVSNDLASGHHTLEFDGKKKYKGITAFCFPHVNDMKIWDLEMMGNDVYRDLKEKLSSFD